jgi:hypothetical protein
LTFSPTTIARSVGSGKTPASQALSLTCTSVAVVPWNYRRQPARAAWDSLFQPDCRLTVPGGLIDASLRGPWRWLAWVSAA